MPRKRNSKYSQNKLPLLIKPRRYHNCCTLITCIWLLTINSPAETQTTLPNLSLADAVTLYIGSSSSDKGKKPFSLSSRSNLLKCCLPESSGASSYKLSCCSLCTKGTALSGYSSSRVSGTCSCIQVYWKTAYLVQQETSTVPHLQLGIVFPILSALIKQSFSLVHLIRKISTSTTKCPSSLRNESSI